MTQYILHEYELRMLDLYTQPREASILYLREFIPNTAPNTLSDPIDSLIEDCIKANWQDYTKKTPLILSAPQDIASLDARLLKEWQLKAYLSFYSQSPSISKGNIHDFSRITLHTTILVKEQKDIPTFENIGFQRECDFVSTAQLMVDHILSPVYTIPEHPSLHGITCRVNAHDRNEMYMLYHHVNPQDQILAYINLETAEVKLRFGTNFESLNDIEEFKTKAGTTNDYSPVYTAQFITGIAPCIPAKLVLNRERDKFKKAKELLGSKLSEQTDQNSNWMQKSLTQMMEA